MASQKSKTERRSPLKRKPLRNPGESLDREIDDALYDEALPWFLAGTAAVALSLLEWWRAFFPSPPAPWALTALATVVVPYGAVRVRRCIHRVRILKQGRDGEKYVGQQLEYFRARGCYIFHDIPGRDFNLDHVLVSPRGIFVIETKTLSKRVDGNPRITFDGSRLLVDELEPERDYLRQVAAQRAWLSDVIEEWSGQHFPVRGVLVFPGWWVEQVRDWRRSGLWVLNPKNLASFLDNEPETLPPSEVARITAGLRAYVESRV